MTIIVKLISVKHKKRPIYIAILNNINIYIISLVRLQITSFEAVSRFVEREYITRNTFMFSCCVCDKKCCV